MDSPSPKPHLFHFLLIYLLRLISPNLTSTAASTTSFDFATSSLQNLTLIGDAYLRNTSIGLTQPTPVPSTSSGAAACNFPINLSASFSTNFSFSISPTTTADINLAGDRLDFFVTSTLSGNEILWSDGNSEIRNGSKRVLVVEFGLGGGGVEVAREETAPAVVLNKTGAGGLGVDLRSGNVITCWIEYDNVEKMLAVWLSYSGEVKPETAVVMASLDFFSDEVRDSMFVGLSATTEGTTITHVIHNWYFQTFGFSDVSPPPTLTSSANPSGNSTWSTSAVIPNSDEHHHRNLHLHLAISGVISLCVLFTFAIWILIKKQVTSGHNHPKIPAASTAVCGTIAAVKSPRKFAYKELSIATQGFHNSQIIGTGSFGTVYRGLTPGTSTNYAVKRSKHHHSDSHHDHRHHEFLSELSIIGGLRHKNLVNLLGWCVEDFELLLVYELMPNGSLDTLLYSSHGVRIQERRRRRRALPWHQRYNIATGVAEAVAYLHEECEQQVIHRDIKTSNIMLDEDFNPRLGDFGLAKLIDHDTTQSPVSTLTAGTLGYLAPEYIQYGIATGKTDVFSFGVVVLEICCGRRPISKPDDDGGGGGGCLVNLVDWVWRSYREDKLVGVVDRGLNGEFELGELTRLLLVGLSCANPDCGQRPEMRQVVQILRGEAEITLMPPRVKPCLMFSESLPRSLKDILSDGDDSPAHHDEA